MPVTEKGYAHSPSHVRRAREKVPALQWPRNQEVYAQMLRTSPKVAQVALAITQPIERATWRVSANGAPDEIVQHVADDLRLPVHGREGGVTKRRHGGRVNWQEHLQRVVQTPFYGVSFFEQVYEVGPDGREHLVKLAPRHNTTLAKINVASDGGLESIEQRPLPGGDPIEIPVDHLVAYVYRPRDTSWTGESLLRPVHKHWQAIADIEALEFQILQRNGMGIPKHKQSLHTPDEERSREREDGLQMAEDLQAGEAAGVTLNPGADLELMGVTGQLVSTERPLAYHNNKIAESVLANFLNLDGGGGSYALAGTQADFFFQELQTIADWIASTANQHIVEDLVQVAFPTYEGPAPLITFTPIAAKKDMAPGDLAQLVNAGALIREPNLEGWLRQNYDIPEARSLYDALRAQKELQEAEEEVGVSLGGNEDDESSSPTKRPAESGQLAALGSLQKSRPDLVRGILAQARDMVTGGYR